MKRTVGMGREEKGNNRVKYIADINTSEFWNLLSCKKLEAIRQSIFCKWWCAKKVEFLNGYSNELYAIFTFLFIFRAKQCHIDFNFIRFSQNGLTGMYWKLFTLPVSPTLVFPFFTFTVNVPIQLLFDFSLSSSYPSFYLQVYCQCYFSLTFTPSLHMYVFRQGYFSLSFPLYCECYLSLTFTPSLHLYVFRQGYFSLFSLLLSMLSLPYLYSFPLPYLQFNIQLPFLFTITFNFTFIIT